MTQRTYALSITGLIAALALAAAVAHAQSPRTPGNVKLKDDAKGIHVSWTAPATSGARYVIERSGPGYTLYTRIAGPIAETEHVVDTTGMDLCRERYTFRVRAVGPESEVSAPSEPVSTSTLKRICNLPLVGDEPLTLIQTLPGYPQPK